MKPPTPCGCGNALCAHEPNLCGSAATHTVRRRGRSDRLCERCAALAPDMPTHDVLCGCGWGRLACPEDELPEECPVCGHRWLPECET